MGKREITPARSDAAAQRLRPTPEVRIPPMPELPTELVSQRDVAQRHLASPDEARPDTEPSRIMVSRVKDRPFSMLMFESRVPFQYVQGVLAQRAPTSPVRYVGG